MHALRIAFFLMAAAVLSACGKAPRISFDSDFSVNVIRVPADWPDEKKDWPEDEALATIQQRIYEKEGAPDFFVVNWNKRGKLLRQEDLATEMLRQGSTRNRQKYLNEKLKGQSFDWLYVDSKTRYSFTKQGFKRTDADDNLITITEYGDPHEIKEIDDPQGKITIYQYYDQGKVFYYRDGKQYKEENQTALPGWNMKR